MPRAVLDSSVLVSAFIASQNELMLLLRLPLRHRYELLLSKEILSVSHHLGLLAAGDTTSSAPKPIEVGRLRAIRA